MLPVPPSPSGHRRRRVAAIAVAAAAVVAVTGVAIAQPWHHDAGTSAADTPVVTTSPSGVASSAPAGTHRPTPRSTSSKRPSASPSETASTVVVPPPGTTAPSAGNHTPTLNVVAAQSTNELAHVSLRLVGADADGNSLHYSLSGSLPAGLSLNTSTGVVSGTIKVSAASVTTKYTSIKSRVFALTATVSDGKQTASRSFTWTVRDTAFVMPNYFNAYGCGNTCSPAAATDNGKPSIAALGSFGTTCTSTRPAGITDTDKIVWQSAAAGSTVTWGTHLTYKYYPCH